MRLAEVEEDRSERFTLQARNFLEELGVRRHHSRVKIERVVVGVESEEFSTSDMTSATVIVSPPDTRSERTYDLSLSVGDLKKKLEPVTGIPISSQILSLFRSDQDSVKIKFLDDNDRPLGYFGVVTGMHIKVDDLNPSLNNTGQFMDVSRVEKFEISKDEYERRPGTVKAFKERNKLGRFAESTPHETKASSRNIPVGARCQVDPESGLNKRGTVRYVGTPKFGVQDGAIWVGIEYDEPVGKNDGSVQGERYFTCSSGYGVFVQPDRVQIGDFPELNINDEEMDEEL